MVKKIKLGKQSVGFFDVVDAKGNVVLHFSASQDGEMTLYTVKSIHAFDDTKIRMSYRKENGSYIGGEMKTIHEPKI